MIVGRWSGICRIWCAERGEGARVRRGVSSETRRSKHTERRTATTVRRSSARCAATQQSAYTAGKTLECDPGAKRIDQFLYRRGRLLESGVLFVSQRDLDDI